MYFLLLVCLNYKKETRKTWDNLNNGRQEQGIRKESKTGIGKKEIGWKKGNTLIQGEKKGKNIINGKRGKLYRVASLVADVTCVLVNA